MYDQSPFKSDFAVFSHPDNTELCYLDSAATCLTPKVVAEAMYQYQSFSHANSHKGLYRLSASATERVEQARVSVAEFIGADADELVFTFGTTEAINLVANSFVRPRLSADKNIVISCAEHHANLLPWQRLCQQTGAELRVASLTPQGLLDVAELAALLDDNTCFIAISHISNVLGGLNPVEQVCRLARQQSIPVLIDGAQAVSHGPVDVKHLDCDFYAFSGHKLYGPAGCGVLFARADCIEVMEPDTLGGGIVEQVTLTETRFIDGPMKFEPGSHNVAAICGLVAAIDYIRGIGWPALVAYMDELSVYLHQQLGDLPFIKPLIPGASGAWLCSFQCQGVHSHDVAGMLDGDDIAVRAGHHCAQPLHHYLGLKSSVRVSLGLYNGREDIDRLVASLKHTYQLLAAD
ncbi:aminotransferase class V-fold PLP-dependent enzyme [Thalassomonas actiniarum]|uniref:Probable cysteine desulfurase n=1 Tax=Thalassomonas actiniarum TaxID=485447 RepID=A0AAF0C2P0_9GAMM|nr:cysteine desulfurase [Thalassomonas actiniarum]WDE00357.1 cysteine desulfurase [Thalassomonas actiniarum]